MQQKGSVAMKSNRSFTVSAVCVTLVLCLTLVMFCAFSFSAFASGTNTLKTICELNLRSSASSSASVVAVIPDGATPRRFKPEKLCHCAKSPAG